MAQEATLVCLDNSDWMRNGDFIPTRLDSQTDAVNLVCRSKLRQNPENTVGIMTLADTQVLSTLTTDVNNVLNKMRHVQPEGTVKFLSGVRIAHLVLKHRQNKLQKMRLIIFIASPLENSSKELEQLGKKLKKEKVNVDVVVFGEHEQNEPLLTGFIEALNGKEGKNSHLIAIQPGGPMLSDALSTSPILRAEDGTSLAPAGSGFEYGIDPSEDPELAMAIRVSLEEQRQRQEDEAKRVQVTSLSEGQPEPVGMDVGESTLASALGQSLPTAEVVAATDGPPDFSAMTEEEQMAYAIQMSMQGGEDQGMEMEEGESTQERESSVEADMDELLQDKDFLQSTFAALPGVNPDEVLQMMQEEQDQQMEGNDDDESKKNKDVQKGK